MPYGTTPEQRFLERLTRRAGAGMTMMWILRLRLRMTVERMACDDDDVDSSPSAQNDDRKRNDNAMQ